MRCGRDGGKNLSQLDLIQIRKIGLQVGVALFADLVLAGGFTVVGIDFVDRGHAFDNSTEGRETHAVEAGVVSIIDEELPGARIGAGRGEDEAAALVALNDGIVLYFRVVPDLVDGRIGAEPELRDEAGNDAKEGHIGEVAVANQVVKAICTERRPVAMDFDDKVARRCGELCLEDRGRLELERCRAEQGRMWPDSGAVGGTALRGSAFGSGGLGVDEEACTQNNDRRNCFHDDRLYEMKGWFGAAAAVSELA